MGGQVITFSPSDIADQNPQPVAATKPVNQPTPVGTPITFSPSDIQQGPEPQTQTSTESVVGNDQPTGIVQTGKDIIAKAWDLYKSGWESEANLYKGATEGMVEGAQGLVGDVEKLAKGAAMGPQYEAPHILPEEGMKAERAMFAPKSTSESVGQTGGKIGEAAIEFVLTDAALGEASLADKLGIAGKIGELAKKSPYLAKLLDHGVTALRLGATQTGLASLHGATPGEAIKQGAEVGATGAVLGAGLETAGKVIPKLNELAGKAAQAIKDTDVRPSIVRGVPEYKSVEEAAISGAKGSGIPEGEVQPITENSQDAIHTTAKGIASRVVEDATGKTLEVPTLNKEESIHDVMNSASNAIKDEAKGIYKTLDDAPGHEGEWNANKNKLDAVRRKIWNADDPDKVQDIIQQQDELKKAQTDLITTLEQEGAISPGDADRAGQLWKQQIALDEVGNAISKTTKGRVGMGPQAVPTGLPAEITNASSLRDRLVKLYNDGTLQDAFGGGPKGEDYAQLLYRTVEGRANLARLLGDFNPTEQQALQEIISKSTFPKIGGKPATGVNWTKAVSQFEKMPIDQKTMQFGADTGKVRSYLYQMAKTQSDHATLIKFLKLGLGTSAVAVPGFAAEQILQHKLLDGK
jgi:hypothetical protein